MVKRRSLLLGTLAAGGALAIGWGVTPVRQRLRGSQPLTTAAGEQALNGWLKIGADDQVTIVLAKSEMGQGVSTALAMLLADELDADWARVRTVMSPIDPIYNNLATVVDGLPFHPDDHGALKRIAGQLTAKTMREVGLMMTGGSSSIKDLWDPMRRAGASARQMLLASAAARWNVPATDCRVAQGVVTHAGSGRSARFGELAADAARQALPDNVALKTPDRFTLIGKPVARRDSAAKSNGTAAFGIDTTLPGLLHASVLMCPTLGGRVVSFDAKAATALPGVKGVFAVPGLHGGTGGVAVVADRHWRAVTALRALEAGVQWDHGPAAGLDSAGITTQLTAALDGSDDGFAYFSQGDAAAVLAGAAKTVKADYHAPPLAHMTMEPQNCTVQFDAQAGTATVWAPTQVPGLARWAAAKALGLDSEKVTMNVTLLGGGFGRRLEVDFVAQAAAIAKAMATLAPGVPVQTLWTREQDTTHDFYRPPCASRWQAGLDAQGKLVAWTARSAGPSIVQQFMQRQWGLPGAGPEKTTAEGAFDQAYEVPAARIAHRIVALPLPVGFWRSVGHSHQAFFKESFIDECANAAGADPLAFRLALLGAHPRHAAVLRKASQMAGWGTPSPAAPDGAKTARGLALHQSFGSIVAQVAEVSLDPADAQRIRVHRVWAAIDCGMVVNPAIVAQQMDSAIVFGLTAALYGEVTLAKGQVQQANFHQQPALKLADCPQIVTEIMPSTEPPEGVGEPGTPPVAPAVANALAALTGQRLRRLPLALG